MHIPVAEVAKTLDRTPAMHPICGQIGYSIVAEVLVAEVAKTLDRTPAMHPISWRDWLVLRTRSRITAVRRSHL